MSRAPPDRWRPSRPAPTVTFIAPEKWIHVEIRLEDFPTATPEVTANLAFVAKGPVGDFRVPGRKGDHLPCLRTTEMPCRQGPNSPSSAPSSL